MTLFPCSPLVPWQPHTLLSLVSVNLAQGNVTGALDLFRQTLALSASCAQCRASLPLLRCLQFYPFLYNLQRSPCPRECPGSPLMPYFIVHCCGN